MRVFISRLICPRVNWLLPIGDALWMSRHNLPEPTDEERRWMAHQRLEVLEGIERAINSAPQVLEAVSACADHDEAAGALSRPPFDFTEQQAYHVLDIQFGRATAGRREALRHEIDELRPLAADASPPPPREEDDFVPPPTDPPRFFRLIAGPDEEREVEGGTIRVISVELFHNSFAVASHRSLEGDVAFSRDLWLHPDVTDNRGTDPTSQGRWPP
jgi:hypothetical protein